MAGRRYALWITLEEVEEATGLSAKRIEQLEAAGRFPKEISGGKKKIWWRFQVNDWVSRRGKTQEVNAPGSS